MTSTFDDPSLVVLCIDRDGHIDHGLYVLATFVQRAKRVRVKELHRVFFQGASERVVAVVQHDNLGALVDGFRQCDWSRVDSATIIHAKDEPIDVEGTVQELLQGGIRA